MSRQIVQNLNELCIRVPIFDEDYRYYQCTKLMTTKSIDVKFAYSRYSPTFAETTEILKVMVEGQQEILDLIYWYLMYEVKISPQGYIVTQAHDWYTQCHKGYFKRNVISLINDCVVIYRLLRDDEEGYINGQDKWLHQMQTKRNFLTNIDLTVNQLEASLIDPLIDEEDVDVWKLILEHVKLAIENNDSTKRSIIVLNDYRIKVDSFTIGIQVGEEGEIASMDWSRSPIWLNNENIRYNNNNNNNNNNDNISFQISDLQ